MESGKNKKIYAIDANLHNLPIEDYASAVIQQMNEELMPAIRVQIKFSESMAGILVNDWLLFNCTLKWLENIRTVNPKGLEELILIRLHDRRMHLDITSAV